MADFDQAYAATNVREGGYANHPDDRGGETYRGISRANWPGWPGWPIIDEEKRRSLSVNTHFLLLSPTAIYQLDAYHREFFRVEFWNRIAGDRIASQVLANELYDSAVLSGVSTAITWMQRALNITNNNGRRWADLDVDGKIGPNTLGALAAAFEQDIEQRVKFYADAYQVQAHIRFAERNPEQEVFIGGWARRAGFEGA